MNYYEHHIGDYAEATSHLTFAEDAAYSRLIRKYYATERPLPADMRAVERLIGARTDEERSAVKAVLEEFFSLAADGWHNKRCDEEIARYQEKRSKARQSANSRWHPMPKHSEGSADGMRSHGSNDANALPPQSEGNALQSPVTNLQSPVSNQISESEDQRAMRTQCERMDTVSHGTIVTEDWFTNFKIAYPQRAGDPGWRKAKSAANARLREGYTAADMVAGAERYAAYCEATDKIGTEFVKQAATFLGPDKHFLAPWTLPANKAQRALDSNISAGQAWLARSRP